MIRLITKLFAVFWLLFLYCSLNAQNNNENEHGNDNIYNEDYAPIMVLSESDLDQNQLSQDISGILQSSSDVFVRAASFSFRDARFRLRGYDNKYTNVLINGVIVNDAVSGRPFWSNWGGLNDAMWNRVITTGIGYSDFGHSGIGGITNIDVRASNFRPQSRVSYSAANRSYNNRIMASYATGMTENGWALSFAASRRWAEQSYVEGTFYDAYSYFAAIEKRINSRHSIQLTAFGTPSRRGRSSPATLEVYELAQNNFYNPNWGYQDGVKRNARVNDYHQPKSILSHYWTINENMSLTTSMAYTFGRGGSTALNWYDSPDPRPDYYRYLPSFFSPGDSRFDEITELWETDVNFRQLDWDSFYHANRKNLFTVNNANGIEGKQITGNRAAYILEERRNDVQRYDFSSVFSHSPKENMRYVAGLNAMHNSTHNFKVVHDLLGADWWLDIDQFAERDSFDENFIQNDIDNPNRVVEEGDIFGYDYNANVNMVSSFLQTEINLKNFDFFSGVELSFTEFYRLGNMRNGRFPDNSFGESRKNQFFNYAVSAGMNYMITGRHVFVLNIANMTKSPVFADAYISPRTRDHLVNNLTSEVISSADFSYLYRGISTQVRATAYYTDFQNQTNNMSFYHDEFRTFVNYALSGIDKVHYGLELGIEHAINSQIIITSAVSANRFLYNSRPKITIARDNDSEVLAEDRVAYIKNFHIAEVPELAGTIELRYNGQNFWFVSANFTYFDNMFVSINPDRRTEVALENLVDSDPIVSDIIDQKRIDPFYTLNIRGGKSWRIRGNFIGFSVSINNVLNNTETIVGGFEQLRYSVGSIERFPEKYFFLYGTTYFTNVYFRF